MVKTEIIPLERVERLILILRGHKVILDVDLAAMYGVEPKAMNQAVKRNLERYPDDFMFQLTEEEVDILRSQTVTSRSWGGRRYLPYAFTEQGVAMLSSVLRSARAVQVNIEIMRSKKLATLEKKYDAQFRIVFTAIRELMAPESRSKRRIGFRTERASPRRE